MTTLFVSGHLDLTREEFDERYAPRIREAAEAGCSFVVGDAPGADTMAQEFLRDGCAVPPPSDRVTVFHMLRRPRNWAGYPLRGGFATDEARDAA